MHRKLGNMGRIKCHHVMVEPSSPVEMVHDDNGLYDIYRQYFVKGQALTWQLSDISEFYMCKVGMK